MEGRNWGYKGKRHESGVARFVGGFKALVKLGWVAIATCFTVETTDFSRGRIHESRNKFQTCTRIHAYSSWTNVYDHPDEYFSTRRLIHGTSLERDKRYRFEQGERWRTVGNTFSRYDGRRRTSELKVNPDICLFLLSFFFLFLFSLHFEKILKFIEVLTRYNSDRFLYD